MSLMIKVRFQYVKQLKQVPIASLSGFIASSKGSVEEEGDLPRVRTYEGFDPNAYKLMMRSGYDFNNQASLEHVVEAKPHGINETQKKEKNTKARSYRGSFKCWSPLCTALTCSDLRSM